MPKDDSTGTTAANFQINGMNGAFQSITANYIATLGDYSITANASSGSLVLTLPALAAVYKGKPYRIMRIDGTLLTTVNVVSATGTKTINGVTSILLTQYNAGVFIFDGTNWWRF